VRIVYELGEVYLLAAQAIDDRITICREAIGSDLEIASCSALEFLRECDRIAESATAKVPSKY
jgi:hypothetical protein